jgi:hypothetical protein
MKLWLKPEDIPVDATIHAWINPENERSI